jgi:hypothetical protein
MGSCQPTKVSPATEGGAATPAHRHHTAVAAHPDDGFPLPAPSPGEWTTWVVNHRWPGTYVGQFAPDLRRAFVNDGGDIAVHLAPGETLAIGMVADPRWPTPDAAIRLVGGDGVGGVATSGRHGRSFSFGIADAVTVLAADAATADAAATLIGNAVNVDSPAIRRAPADSLDPDSDLGARLVTVAVETLTEDEVAAALEAGAARARHWVAAGLIRAAALRVQGQAVSVP